MLAKHVTFEARVKNSCCTSLTRSTFPLIVLNSGLLNFFFKFITCIGMWLVASVAAVPHDT